MRWPWQKVKAPKVEIPDNARYVVTRTGRALVVPPPPDVVLEPAQYRGVVVPRPVPGMDFDPYDINPSFHVRYEDVKVGYMVNLKALRHNLSMVGLQIREVFVDPKRVGRRYWHRYMIHKRRKQILEDSRLFWSPPRVI